MDELRVWFEVPTIAHYCYIFRAAFDLTEFEIEDLEDGLLVDGTAEGKSFIPDLIAKLLRGLYRNNSITNFNYQRYLVDLLDYHYTHLEGKPSPLQDVEFRDLTTRQKVEIIYDICHWRLEVDDIQELLKGRDAEELRVEPIGRDAKGCNYWYFFGSRLYKETPIIEENTAINGNIENEHKEEKRKPRKRKRKRKAKKKKTKKRRRAKWSSESESSESEESSDDSSDEEWVQPVDNPPEEVLSMFITGPCSWKPVCFTLQDWQDLTDSFKDSEHQDEINLYEVLSEHYLEKIAMEVEARELAMQKKFLEMAPRRASDRIAFKMSIKDEEDRSYQLDREEEEERKWIEAEERRKEQEEKRKREREERVKERERVAEERRKEREERARQREEQKWAIENPELAKELQLQALIKEERSENESHSESEKSKVRSRPGMHHSQREDDYPAMYKVIDALKKHKDIWPFLEPVDEAYAPQYYDIVKNPIDIATIEKKLDNNEYENKEGLVRDMKLMFTNCLQYNGNLSDYTKMANRVDHAFQKQIVKQFPEDKESNDEDYVGEFQESRKRRKRNPSETNKSTKLHVTSHESIERSFNTDTSSNVSHREEMTNKILPGRPNGIHPGASGVLRFGNALLGNALLSSEMLRAQAMQAQAMQAQGVRAVNPLMDMQGIPNRGNQMPFPPRPGVPPNMNIAGNRVGPAMNFFGTLLRAPVNTIGEPTPNVRTTLERSNTMERGNMLAHSYGQQAAFPRLPGAPPVRMFGLQDIRQNQPQAGPPQAVRFTFDQIPSNMKGNPPKLNKPQLPFQSYVKEEDNSKNEDLKTQKLNALHAIIEDPASDDSKKRVTVEESNARVRSWLNAQAAYFGLPQDDKSDAKQMPVNVCSTSSTKATTKTKNSMCPTGMKDKSPVLQNGLIYPSTVRLSDNDNRNDIPRNVHQEYGEKHMGNVRFTEKGNISPGTASSPGQPPVRTLVIVPSKHDANSAPGNEADRRSPFPTATINAAEVSRGFHSLTDLIKKSSANSVTSSGTPKSVHEQPKLPELAPTMPGGMRVVLAPGDRHSRSPNITHENLNAQAMFDRKQGINNVNPNSDPNRDNSVPIDNLILNMIPKSTVINPNNAALLYANIMKSQALFRHQNLLLRISSPSNVPVPNSNNISTTSMPRQQIIPNTNASTYVPNANIGKAQELFQQNMLLRFATQNNASNNNSNRSQITSQQNHNLRFSTTNSLSNPSIVNSMESLQQQHREIRQRFSAPNNIAISSNNNNNNIRPPLPQQQNQNVRFSTPPTSSVSNMNSAKQLELLQQQRNAMLLRFSTPNNAFVSNNNTNRPQKPLQQNKNVQLPTSSVSNVSPDKLRESFLQQQQMQLRFAGPNNIPLSNANTDRTQKMPQLYQTTPFSPTNTSDINTAKSKGQLRQHQSQPSRSAAVSGNNAVTSQTTAERPMPSLLQRAPALIGTPTNLVPRFNIDMNVNRSRMDFNVITRPSPLPLFPDQRCQNSLAEQLAGRRLLEQQNLYVNQSGEPINISPMFLSRGVPSRNGFPQR